MPLDQALIGTALTGILALFSQALSKCKCRVVCARGKNGECAFSSGGCGFLDAPLFQPDANDKEDDASEPA